MRQVIFVATLSLVLAACQGGDRSSTQRSTSQPAAGAPAADASGAVGKALEKIVDPNVSGCIDKVQARQFAEALPLCMAAANANPDNQDVKSALAEARRKAANLASAGQQAGAAMDAARRVQQAGDAAKAAASAGEQAGAAMDTARRVQQAGDAAKAAASDNVPAVPGMPKMP